MKKQRVILIGLGQIARHHAQALAESAKYELCGVCDIKQECAFDSLYSHLPFDTDYNRLIAAVCPDAAIIATPPFSHVRIAQDCVAHGIHAFVEKPLSDKRDGVESFFSENMLGCFTAICHNIYGEEVLWFEKNIRLNEIEQISLQLTDPYLSADGTIRSDRRPLGGCWIDSGSNALALLSRFINLRELNQVEIEQELDTTCYEPIKSRLNGTKGKTLVQIDILWSKEENSKSCIIKADNHEYLLDNSGQAVWCDGNLLFQSDKKDRLTAHYSNFYRLYPQHQVPDDTLRALYELLEAGKKTVQDLIRHGKCTLSLDY